MFNKDCLHEDNSPVESCSIDLHIGDIYIPETKHKSYGGKFNPEINYTLEPGNSVLVRTDETLNMPADIGAICFAPFRYSIKGLLIVNIGHIDPGYKGKLHYTVVNLGKKEFNLNKNDVISTLLVFKLSDKTKLFGAEQFININGKKISKTVNDSLPYLSKTFMNFEKKAKQIVKKEINYAQLTVPILTGLVSILLTIYLNIFVFNVDKVKIATIESNLVSVEKKIDIINQLTDTKNNVNTINSRVSDIEKIINSLKINDKK
jgi:deoxycytidine triphosphate deaminase